MITPIDIEKNNRTVSSLISYMVDVGWVQSESMNEALRLFILPLEGESSPVKLYLPADESVADAPQRIVDAIRVVAGFQGKEPEEVLDVLKHRFKDILNIRIDRNALLSVEQGAEFLGLLRSLLMYAASAEKKPAPHFLKALPIGVKQPQRTLLGHTRAGSFVFTIESPILQGNLPGIVGKKPFNRRVMERIIRGLRQIVDAANNGDINSLESQYVEGMNSNMLDVVAGMYEKGTGANIEFSMDWAPALPPDDLLRDVGPVTVDSRAYLFMQFASGAMRPHGSSESIEIRGYVRSLMSETMESLVAAEPVEEVDEGDEPELFETKPEEDLGEIQANNVVKVVWERKPGTKKRVTVLLGPTDYAKAIDAHKFGKKIAIRGDLRKVRNRLYLDNPFDVRILD